MVFFTCNLCGSPLKKNQVDKHVFQCRTQSVSCMDCQKDFGMKEYASHTKCVSEAEKYGGGDWKAPSNFNKGEKKQQAWVDTVSETLKSAGPKLNPPSRSLLQTLAKHDNVPRKKSKFLNFINNVARNRFDSNTLENVWNLLEEQWKSQAEANKKSVVAKPSHSEKVKNGDHKIEVENLGATPTENTVLKKKKSKKNKEQVEDVVLDVTATEDDVVHKKKKRKKDDEVEDLIQDITATEDNVHKKKKREKNMDEVEDLGVTTESGVNKKKKHKKDKYQVEDLVLDVTATEGDVVPKKKKRKKNIKDQVEDLVLDDDVVHKKKKTRIECLG